MEPDTVEKVEVIITDVEKARLERIEHRPSLDEVLNLHDFEAVARQVMPEKAWAYYSSAADDEITNRENHAAYHRLTIYRIPFNLLIKRTSTDSGFVLVYSGM